MLTSRLRPLAVLVLLVVSRATAQPPPAEPVPNPTAAGIVISGPTMGTSYTVKMVGRLKQSDEAKLRQEIQALLDDINRKMSTYLSDSELMHLNSADLREWLPVSGDLFSVLEEALHWSRKTDGAFDVTIGALVNLWGFGALPGRFAVPPESELQRALRQVGFEHIQLRSSPPALKKHQPVLLDLSAIAKGYAVDRMAELLRSRGWENYLVEIGGELKGAGSNLRGEPWRVAVDDPGGGDSLPAIPLSGTAVATSGDYRQFMLRNGRRLPHILDPRSGRPVDHALASVTVVHESAMSADALATGLMTLGPERGFELARQEQLAAFFLERRGNELVSRMTLQFRLQLDRKGAAPK